MLIPVIDRLRKVTIEKVTNLRVGVEAVDFLEIMKFGGIITVVKKNEFMKLFTSFFKGEVPMQTGIDLHTESFALKRKIICSFCSSRFFLTSGSLPFIYITW